MQRQWMSLGLVMFLVCFLVGCDGQGGRTVGEQATTAAVTNGRSWLWARQQRDGSWPDDGSQFPGGSTALASWAMLASGVELDNPNLSRALNYLAGLETNMTYTLAIRANVWAEAAKLDKAKYQPLLGRDIRALTRGTKEGSYSYQTDDPAVLGDQSNSHYAVMGVERARENNIEVPAAYWKMVMNYWLKVQNRDGGWPYSRSGTPSTETMTTAAIATLALCMDKLGPDRTAQAAIDRGAAWLEKQMPESLSQNRLMYYYFLALGRMEDLTGRGSLGGVDLSKRVRAELLARQMPDGGWEGVWGRDIASAYAVLVLSRDN
ncbi:MAG: hypothetical protein ACLFUJ_04310 [Phycisphaerae bacterium]